MSDLLKAGAAFYLGFRDSGTGDALTVTAIHNAALDGALAAAVTITTLAGGFRVASGTVPSGYAPGDKAALYATDTAGLTIPIGSFIVAAATLSGNTNAPNLDYKRLGCGESASMAQGDTRPGFESLPQDGAENTVDISAATVTFRLGLPGGSAPAVVQGVATAAAAADGMMVARYALSASDAALLTPQDYSGQFIATWGSGANAEQVAFPTEPFNVTIEPAVPPATA